MNWFQMLNCWAATAPSARLRDSKVDLVTVQKLQEPNFLEEVQPWLILSESVYLILGVYFLHILGVYPLT